MIPLTNEPADDDSDIARQLRDLGRDVLPAADATFREALRRRTAAAVRRRPLWRRIGTVAAMLLVYGAGIATARLAWVGDRLRPVDPGRPATAAPAAAADLAAVEPRLEDADPSEIERRALASPRERRVELLRLAGDRYLGEGQDVDAALRCYRAALSLMRREKLAAVSVNETWLFAALKTSRS
jgi:hypothetical protein